VAAAVCVFWRAGKGAHIGEIKTELKYLAEG